MNDRVCIGYGGITNDRCGSGLAVSRPVTPSGGRVHVTPTSFLYFNSLTFFFLTSPLLPADWCWITFSFFQTEKLSIVSFAGHAANSRF